MQPGATIHAVPLTISGHVWTYGGVARGDDGVFYRTINDFSSSGSYSWRQESSRDSVHWVPGPHGHVVRVP
jgi:hypothetical protein